GLGDACDECPLDVDEVSAYTAGVPALGIAPSPLTPDSDEDGTPDSCDETPFGNGTQVDGGRPTDAALRPGTSSVRIDATVERGGAAWLPIDPCGGRCAGDWDERTFVILSFESLTPETRAAVLDDRGRVAAATSRHGSRRLQFRPRGGRRYALWLAPQPDRAGAISAVLSIDLGDAIRPEPDDACHGRANGLPCRISDLQAGICIDDACEPARCGDGFVTGTEECEDLNDASGDGCEPGTCQRSCELDSECDDGQACDGIETCSPVLFLCLAGRPLDEGTPCTLTAGGAGTCRSGTCATGGCGNGAPDPGEQCDDGDTMDGDGCDNDCTYSCTTTADCDDGNPCNGMESCFEASHSCIVGRPPDCADANACTADACSPAMPGGCTHVPVDADGDGASPTSLGACGTDCDDTSAAIHPGATEVCNGVDDDCDGMIDDVSRTCERDMDGDRFADETMTMTACECPAGWIEPNPRDPPDCADWRADVYPGAEAFHDTYYCDSPSVTSCPQSYDYDCNNFEQPENATVSTGCVVSGVGCAGGGWEGGVPACGTDGTQISCLRIGMLCTPFRTTVRLRCR
ncbi:MAG: hypothetical protein IT379_20090, partial [Deltaproteobacteria bacterium]|nr:hypothetical protein [Deltaproteobacteria bacterium]